ncbi:MAG: hypothetical protein IJC43_07885 [Clostridia bacterium]|nr:hypothetical protein [Clostridia bacterium]
MKLRDIIRRHPILTLLALPPLFLAASYLLGLLLEPLLIGNGLIFLIAILCIPMFPFLVIKGVAIFFECFESVRAVREQEEQQPGSVVPEELNHLRLRATLAVLIPLALVSTTFGYTVLLGNAISFM